MLTAHWASSSWGNQSLPFEVQRNLAAFGGPSSRRQEPRRNSRPSLRPHPRPASPPSRQANSLRLLSNNTCSMRIRDRESTASRKRPRGQRDFGCDHGKITLSPLSPPRFDITNCYIKGCAARTPP